MISSSEDLAPLAARPTEWKPPATATADLSVAAQTNILNLTTTRGQLGDVTVVVDTAPGATVTVSIEINIDDQGFEALTIYNASLTWEPIPKALSGDATQDGGTAGHHFRLRSGALAFDDSCVVRFNVTSTGSGILRGVAEHGVAL